MLEHNLSEPAPSAEPEKSTTFVEARIEDFLDQVCAPLVKVIPYGKRTELRAEMRQHLEALIAAHRELGSAEAEAVSQALAQVGSADALAKRWRQEWERTTGPTAASLVEAKRVALKSFGVMAAISVLALLITGDLVNYSHGLWLLILLVFWMPLLAGAFVGIQAEARPARSVLSALSRLSLPMTALYTLMAAQAPSHYPWYAGTLLGGVQCVCWTLFGTSAAGLSGWARKTFLRIRERALR